MKKIAVLLISLLLISCGKGEKEDIGKDEKFEPAFVALKTYYYKKPVLKGGSNYKGELKRGQKISLAQETKVQNNEGVKHYFAKCKLPGSDDVYWVKSKYEFKSGYEREHVYATPMKIAAINKDAYFYKHPDIHSKRNEIKAGVRVFILEQKAEWSKVNIIISATRLKDINPWMKNIDLSPGENTTVTFEMKKYIPDIGNVIFTSSSNYSDSIGEERLHTADMAFDGKKSTAWIENGDGPGRGEWIKITFKDGQRKFNLSIMNGYTANEKIYKINARIKKIKVETDMETKIIELKDGVMDFQYLGTFTGSYAKLVIDDVYEGKDPDASISEIQIKAGQGSPSAETSSVNSDSSENNQKNVEDSSKINQPQD